MDNLENMDLEVQEQEARANALRQVISQTADDNSMATYAARAGHDPVKMPEIRRAWIAELRKLDGNAPTLDEIKSDAIMETRVLLEKALETPIRFKDRLYSVTLEKQNLLSAQLGLFGLNTQAGIQTDLTWNATGEPCDPWAFEDLLTLSNTIAAYVKPLAQLQRDAEVEINKSTTEGKVQKAVSAYAAALTSATSV